LSIVVLGADDDTQPGSLAFFLRRVCQSTPLQEINFLALTDRAAVTPDGTRPDFLVATDGEGVAPTLRHHLDQVGTALLLLIQEGSANTLRQVAGVESLPVSEGQTRQYALLGRIEFGHPLFAPFLDLRFSDFSRIHCWK